MAMLLGVHRFPQIAAVGSFAARGVDREGREAGTKAGVSIRISLTRLFEPLRVAARCPVLAEFGMAAAES
jgi:hypothetical protein